MAYETLKGVIRDAIQENGAGAITGDLLQGVLLAVVNALGGDIQTNASGISTLNGKVTDLEPFVVSGTIQNGTDFVPDEGEASWQETLDAVFSDRLVILYANNGYVDVSEVVISADENGIHTKSWIW